jgi:hypothetical protein
MEKLEQFGGDAPVKRPGQPAELTGIYVRLAEDDESCTTGNIYGAGGGKGRPRRVRSGGEPHAHSMAAPCAISGVRPIVSGRKR